MFTVTSTDSNADRYVTIRKFAPINQATRRYIQDNTNSNTYTGTSKNN
jgi:hypothetical protein